LLLGVNIDHIATLRNARGGSEPNLIRAALICQKCKVNGVTTHLREDRRHIKDEDLAELKKIENLRINLEMAATEQMQEIALRIKPEAACIVPEKRAELTTEGGLDVFGQTAKIAALTKALSDNGTLVSLFIDPDEEQVRASAQVKAQYIELHTGSYANAFGTSREEAEFLRLKEAAKLASSLGLRVNAGHGLDYQNVMRMHEIPELEELNIGHSIISRAVFVGLEAAVLEMKALVEKRVS